jgi:hypothetical protein
MNNIAFKSDLKLNSKSRQFYVLPVFGSFRVSFWFKTSNKSFPCEISSNSPINLGKNNSVLTRVNNDFSSIQYIKKNETYFIGIYPNNIIGEGIITEVFS